MEQPREPMPSSWAPVWRFMGWMLVVMIVMAVIAAIIDLIVEKRMLANHPPATPPSVKTSASSR